MPTDIEIAQSCTPRPIAEIAREAGIPEDALSPYGRIVAKVDPLKLSGEELPEGEFYKENRLWIDNPDARKFSN